MADHSGSERINKDILNTVGSKLQFTQIHFCNELPCSIM